MSAPVGARALVAIVRPGPLATVQDLGRRGVMDLGIPVSGAMDQRSHRLANRLVGNPESHATIEATMGGLTAWFSHGCVVAVTGADVDVFVDDRQEGTNARLLVAAGQTVRLGTPRAGLRSYLAVRGGIDVPGLFGSRATDLLSGLGPDPLAAGTTLPVGRVDGADAPAVSAVPVAMPEHHVACRVHPGPRRDWLTPEAWDVLTSQVFTVGSRSNRIGVRLEGATLERLVTDELPSEGLVTGAIQVPGSGEPLVFLRDHPTTGGYPVIGVVDPADLDALGQLAPGDTLAFRRA